MVCNPPFGTKIKEKRKSVLRNFDLGYEWEIVDNKAVKTDKLLKWARNRNTLSRSMCKTM